MQPGCCPQIFPFVLLPWLVLLAPCGAFQHKNCNRKVASQFQFDDCYLPTMDTSLLFSSASFLMSHNAATGYVRKGSLSPSGMTWRYSKNQVGTAYQQLQDGARSLDLRPLLLSNGTVAFQHGGISLPVHFQTLIDDAVRWCTDHEDDQELVILLASDFGYQQSTVTNDDGGNNIIDDDMHDDNNNDTPQIVSAMAAIYEEYSIPYLHCNDVYGLSIKEIMKIAALPTGGFLLALDGKDYYGTPCAKPNWVESELVSCYSTYQNTTISCARRDRNKFAALQAFMLASANNEPSDDKNTLGPPANLYNYPLNEIQAFWQVTPASAVTGVARLSSILDDNQRSKLNEELVDLIYDGQFSAISVFAVDNVALHGNAILSVLRTACGQSSAQKCGRALPKPKISYFQLSSLIFPSLLCLYLLVVLWVGITVVVAVYDKEALHPRLLLTIFQRLHIEVFHNKGKDSQSFQQDQPDLSSHLNEYVLA